MRRPGCQAAAFAPAQVGACPVLSVIIVPPIEKNSSGAFWLPSPGGESIRRAEHRRRRSPSQCSGNRPDSRS